MFSFESRHGGRHQAHQNSEGACAGGSLQVGVLEHPPPPRYKTRHLFFFGAENPEVRLIPWSFLDRHLFFQKVLDKALDLYCSLFNGPMPLISWSFSDCHLFFEGLNPRTATYNVVPLTATTHVGGWYHPPPSYYSPTWEPNFGDGNNKGGG